ncbi:MAG: SCO family protein [Planctomycetota bacterium]|nr:SCO family protein [Planctomycetaceae bacterium]MDQ3329852.1 SCO family protein [Planctomycetota bacterium]
MSEQQAAPKARRLSLFLWVTGAALWLIVLVLAVGIFTRRGESEAPSIEVEVVDSPTSDGASGVVVKTPKETTPIWNPNGVADFSFTERSGETVTKQDLLGKPWIVGFIFTRCAGPCPKVSGQMSVLQDALADADVRLVTMTVDPDYDTPDVLSRYAEAYGADAEKWLFLTGDKDTLHGYITKEFLQSVEEMQGADRKPGFEVLHTTNLMLVDAKGVVRGKYNAQEPEDMAKLRRDVKRLKS